MAKIGRNSTCPCGSGEKYKKCCLNKTSDDSKREYEKKIENLFADECGHSIQIRDSSRAKMSEVLLEYAGELLSDAPDFEGEKQAIMVSVIAWNLSLLDEDDCNKHLLKFIKAMRIKVGSEDHKEMCAIFDALILKKQMEYPSVNRFILNYEFTPIKDGYNLNVMSSIMPGE